VYGTGTTANTPQEKRSVEEPEISGFSTLTKNCSDGHP